MFGIEKNGKNFENWSEQFSPNFVGNNMNSVVEAEVMYNISGPDLGPHSAWSDEDLLLEYRLTSCRELFEELIQRYEHPLFAFLNRYLGNAEDAEEVFQSAFLKVHLKCETFEEGRKFKPWLYRIATNIAIDRIRRDQKQQPMLSFEADFESEENESFGLSQVLPGNEPQPFESTLVKEQVELLHKAILELPEQLRIVLELVYFDGLSYRDTAEVLGLPFGTVKSRLGTAVKKLNSALK